MFDYRDPTREATCAPRNPMTPAELDSYRPKPAVTLDDEAKRISYRLGMKEIEPLVRRLLLLEATVAEQAIQITALQTTVLKLKHKV